MTSPIPRNDESPNASSACRGRGSARGAPGAAPRAAGCGRRRGTDDAAGLGLGRGEHLLDRLESLLQAGVEIPLLEFLDEGTPDLPVASLRQGLGIFAGAFDFDLGVLLGDQDVEAPGAVLLRALGEDDIDVPTVERIDGLDGDGNSVVLLQLVESALRLADGVGGEQPRVVADRRGVRRGDRGRQDQRQGESHRRESMVVGTSIKGGRDGRPARRDHGS